MKVLFIKCNNSHKLLKRLLLKYSKNFYLLTVKISIGIQVRNLCFVLHFKKMFGYFLQFIFIHDVKLLLFKHQYVVAFLL